MIQKTRITLRLRHVCTLTDRLETEHVDVRVSPIDTYEDILDECKCYVCGRRGTSFVRHEIEGHWVPIYHHPDERILDLITKERE